MSKWIHNISNVVKNYHNHDIELTEFFQIPDNLLSEYTSNLNLLNDLINNEVTMSSNGISDIAGTGSNQIDFLKSIDSSPRDQDGALISRPKAAKTGWSYHITAPEFKTSQLNSLFHEDISGNVTNEVVVRYFNSSGTELTTQEACDTDCVRSVLTFEPTWDYEIIGGTIKATEDVQADLRVWVVAVPDVPKIYGGSKVMAQGINLKFVDPNNGLEVDGRASKYLTYSNIYHTNKLQVTIKHPAGHKEELMVAFELFRS